jgi:GNAT superfamily N-acetyltransferase
LAAVIETFAETPDAAARDVLYELLGADNSRKSGRTEKSDFAVLITAAPGGDVIGGLWAVDDCGWAFIDLLYVPEQLQGQRFGSRLLGEAEAIARRRGLIGMWTNTYDFQARGFYEKQGFMEFGSLENGPDAAGQSFLKKRF